MKVSELEGAELDYWVAKALGLPVEMLTPGEAKIPREPRPGGHWYEFSSKWEQGGPIIERECIELECGDAIVGHTWYANIAIIADCDQPSAIGPTPLIAAMRCFVASKFGDTVED